MARRRYQKGSLVRKGGFWDGRWREDVVGPDGRVRRVHRRRRVGSLDDLPTKRLAQREFDRLLADVNAPDYRPQQVARLSQLAERWRRTILLTFKPATQRPINSHLRVWIEPRLGAKWLEALSAPAIQEFLGGLPVGPKSRRNIAATLRMMFESARQWGWVRQNPLNGVRLERGGLARRPAYTLEEIQRLIAAAPEPWATLFALLAETGLRIGEAAALRAGDLDGAVLCVERARSAGKVTTPKSAAAVRRLALSAGLAERLPRLLERGGFDVDNVRQRVLVPLCRQLGIEPKGFHGFRRFNSTQLVRARVPIKTAQVRLGHADPRVTLGIYAQAVDADNWQAAEQMGDLLA